MTTPKKIFEGFSISHAQIMDGTKTFVEAAFASVTEDYDVYGVSDGSLDPDTDSFDNTGDDAVLSRWQWLNFAQVQVTAGFISLPLLATMTGRSITTTASPTVVGNTVYSMDLWHEDTFNVQSRPMMLKVPSRDSQGLVRNLLIGLYRVDFAPITFDGPAYKDGLKANYGGTAVLTGFDEKGVAFGDGKKRVATLVSVGSAAPA